MNTELLMRGRITYKYANLRLPSPGVILSGLQPVKDPARGGKSAGGAPAREIPRNLKVPRDDAGWMVSRDSIAVVGSRFVSCRHTMICAGLTALLLLASCSGNSAEKEPGVPVQVVAVEKTTVERTVVAEAILFPLQQSAITPKISAPVKAFYIKRGSRVRQGQLLAVLENRDLAAAAQENQGAYKQAQAAYETATAASLPEEIQKATLDTQAAKQMFDAHQKVYDSRQELYQQGAMPRKELDQAGVDLTEARNQYEIAQKHLDALMAIGKEQELKSAAGQLQSSKGKYLGAQAQLGYSEIRSPVGGVVADRPLYPGEMAAAGTPLLTVMDISQV